MAGTETIPIELARMTLATLARAAQAGGRFEEMYGFARRLVTAAHGRLTNDERELLLAALTGAVTSAQTTWRALVADGPPREQEVVGYIGQLRAALDDHADGWQAQIGALVAVSPAEYAVRFHLLAGDQYAALAELIPDQRAAYTAKAVASYEPAVWTAIDKLAPTHPVRLGLILNYATCAYEDAKERKKAVELAKRALDEAVGLLDRVDQASYEAVTARMQALRDRLTTWAAEDHAPASA